MIYARHVINLYDSDINRQKSGCVVRTIVCLQSSVLLKLRIYAFI